MADLRCVLADDEPLALELLESLVRSLPGVVVTAACRSGSEALEAIRADQPDIAFLDIEMPGLSGFGVVRELQPETMPAVIFTTAFNQYAIKAFEVHAVDYVLKPLNADRLAMAVERAKLRLAGQQKLQAGIKESILGAIGQLSGQEEPDGSHSSDPLGQDQQGPRKLLIRDAGKTHVVDPADIDWVDAAGDYMCVHVGAETLVMRTTMKKLEEELDEWSFVRIHRSTLVNVSRVQKIETLGKGDCILHLPDGVTLKASRNFREQLMNLLT